MTRPDPMPRLRAALAQAASAVADMAQAVEDGGIRPFDNIGSGETQPVLAGALCLLLEATDEAATDETAAQLLGALSRYLEDHT